MKRESAARFGVGYLDYDPKEVRKPDLLVKPNDICIEVSQSYAKTHETSICNHTCPCEHLETILHQAQ